jgi:hypothetical protein
MGKALRVVTTSAIGFTFIVLAVGLTQIVSCVDTTSQSPPRLESWEYKILYVPVTPSFERLGEGALNTTAIALDEAQLNLRGKDRWELASSFLESETAFPNLSDNQKYVTGLQANVRPKRAILLFKRVVK